jgi:hypothetical protein
MHRVASYVADTAHFDQCRRDLKQTHCPHCHQVGFLICHGFLRGYGQHPTQKIQRGWRVFCSNRAKREGCGRTHGILLAHVLRRRTVSASVVWSFFERVLSGLNLHAAWRTVGGAFCAECAYRLWNAWEGAQTWIRSRLCRVATPVASSADHFLLHTLEHLRRAFGTAQNPISAFQLHFQKPFFPTL